MTMSNCSCYVEYQYADSKTYLYFLDTIMFLLAAMYSYMNVLISIA